MSAIGTGAEITILLIELTKLASVFAELNASGGVVTPELRSRVKASVLKANQLWEAADNPPQVTDGK